MKKDTHLICGAVIACCAIMALVDGVLTPPYFIKSAVKVLLFLLVPIGLSLRRDLKLFSILSPDRKAVLPGLALGLSAFALILGGYTFLQTYLDLSGIPAALEQSAGVTKDNFLFVGLYIALCNSLLEEFFFRGFAFLMLRKVASKRFAYFFSAGAFAIYHAGFMGSWFSPILFVLMLTVLTVCGLFFNFMNDRRKRIWVSWLTHLFANLAINIIGMKLLGMF